METQLLRMFQRQVLFQCHAVLFAAVEINSAMEEHKSNPLHGSVDFDRTFYGIQNLLTSAANISKACWGAGGKFTAERLPLRDSIGVSDTSPLYNMSMRNNFEHYDERLDHWWREAKLRFFGDFVIGTSEHRILEAEPIDMFVFRHYNYITNEVTFWGQVFDIHALVNEVQRILPIVTREAAKPHLDR